MGTGRARQLGALHTTGRLATTPSGPRRARSMSRTLTAVGQVYRIVPVGDPRCVVRDALILSDLHLGWCVCAHAHRELLGRLPEAAGDAELIILNGDIVDAHRGDPIGERAELVARLGAHCER